MKKKKYYHPALTIAGSDSGGGAGIQADLRTFAAYGVFGCTAITAVTAQNPYEVRRIDPLPPGSVVEQIRAVAAKFALKSLKTGMLFDSGIISAAAAEIKKLGVPSVVDPVMVATSGAVLLKPDAIESMKDELMPLAEWATPNIHEAEILCGRKLRTFSDMVEASCGVSEKWKCGCIVKGGHLPAYRGMKRDAVAFKGRTYELSAPSIRVRTSHGTGCTFSAALASAIALGLPWLDSIVSARAFVQGSLEGMILVAGGIEALYPPVRLHTGKTSIKEI